MAQYFSTVFLRTSRQLIFSFSFSLSLSLSLHSTNMELKDWCMLDCQSCHQQMLSDDKDCLLLLDKIEVSWCLWKYRRRVFVYDRRSRSRYTLGGLSKANLKTHDPISHTPFFALDSEIFEKLVQFSAQRHPPLLSPLVSWSSCERERERRWSKKREQIEKREKEGKKQSNRNCLSIPALPITLLIHYFRKWPRKKQKIQGRQWKKKWFSWVKKRL